MPSIAELLPVVAVKEISKLSTVSVGQVYRMKFDPQDGVKPKNPGDDSRNKYFVVLGKDDECIFGCALINSEINTKVLSPYEQLYQYPLRNYEKAGFVDCVEIFPVPQERFIDRKASYRFTLTIEDVKYILESICTNGQISPAEIRRYKIRQPE